PPPCPRARRRFRAAAGRGEHSTGAVTAAVRGEPGLFPAVAKCPPQRHPFRHVGEAPAVLDPWRGRAIPVDREAGAAQLGVDATVERRNGSRHGGPTEKVSLLESWADLSEPRAVPSERGNCKQSAGDARERVRRSKVRRATVLAQRGGPGSGRLTQVLRVRSPCVAPVAGRRLTRVGAIWSGCFSRRRGPAGGPVG